MLTRAAWACASCGRVCGDKREAHADHVVPVSEGGARYDVANGQCLCVRCHGKKTRAEQNCRAARAETQPADRPEPATARRQGGSNHPRFEE